MEPSLPTVFPTLQHVDGVWLVRLERNGKVQEYRCATEGQARALALVLAPRPAAVH
ncbi:MAG: hypothetical protein JNJ54_24180 [Myxococcaceae bacterium]|nr:hypothetical protein [Myxococcaceae bacterium]